jgi:predicted dehydrogenase
MADASTTSPPAALAAAPVALAVVGCGAVTQRRHAPALQALSDTIRVVACVDPNLDGAQALAAHFPGAVATASLAEGLDRGAQAALIAAPTHLHVPLAAECVRRGVSVLVEKPLARTAQEARDLLAEARARGCTVAVGHMWRFHPICLWIREQVAGGALGAIRRVAWREGREFAWPVATASLLHRQQAGGGILMEQGIHILDLLRWWLGPLCVTAFRDDAWGGVEANCWWGGRTEDGAEVELELSATRSLPNVCRFEGSRACMELEVDEPKHVRWEGPTARGVRVEPEQGPATFRALYRAQLAAFVRALRGEAAEGCSPADAVATLDLVAESYRIRSPHVFEWQAFRGLVAA